MESSRYNRREVGSGLPKFERKEFESDVATADAVPGVEKNFFYWRVGDSELYLSRGSHCSKRIAGFSVRIICCE